MKTLKEYLSDRADQANAEAVSRAERRDRWYWSVQQLVDSISLWLREADEKKVLVVNSRHVPLNEKGLGLYSAPMLEIVLGNRVVAVEPVGLNTFGPVAALGDSGIRAEGRVDLIGPERTYRLYRVCDADGDRWLIVDDESYRARPFDRETFEAALQGMFG